MLTKMFLAMKGAWQSERDATMTSKKIAELETANALMQGTIRRLGKQFTDLRAMVERKNAEETKKSLDRVRDGNMGTSTKKQREDAKMTVYFTWYF